MSEWITDRLPKKADLVGVEREVWHYCSDQGYAFRCHWSDIKKLGEPWQPIQAPAPYVKPKRWKIEFYTGLRWVLSTNKEDGNFASLPFLQEKDAEVAQRICDIYNEVMP
jgi:hypothetical protein